MVPLPNPSSVKGQVYMVNAIYDPSPVIDGLNDLRTEKEIRDEIDRLKILAVDELGAQGVENCSLILQMISALNWALGDET
jgi:hypothetical protein